MASVGGQTPLHMGLNPLAFDQIYPFNQPLWILHSAHLYNAWQVETARCVGVNQFICLSQFV